MIRLPGLKKNRKKNVLNFKIKNNVDNSNSDRAVTKCYLDIDSKSFFSSFFFFY